MLHLGFAILNLWLSRYDEAWQHLKTCLTFAEENGSAWGKAWAQELLAEIAFESGRVDMVEEPFQGTLAMFKQIGDLRGQGRALNFLGNMAIVQGRCDAARGYFEHMLANMEQIGVCGALPRLQ